MFDETRVDNPKKYFRVLSCVIYNIINNYICINYLACQYFFKVKHLWVIEGVINMETKVLTEYWVLEFHFC